MNIACDFNGVLCDRASQKDGTGMGDPLPGAVSAMNELKQRGHSLYIFTDMATTEKGTQVVADWLDHYGIPYDGITNSKMKGIDLFIDDKAYHFKGNWQRTLDDILALHGTESRPRP